MQIMSVSKWRRNAPFSRVSTRSATCALQHRHTVVEILRDLTIRLPLSSGRGGSRNRATGAGAAKDARTGA